MSHTRDHPRACGEHVISGLSFRSLLGSSPRLRGTPRAVHGYADKRGIIPALAGNTLLASAVYTPEGDHPRACGEHVSALPPATALRGSSPRLRGTLAAHGRQDERPGIIPALAGNTASFDRSICSFRDHPRACGEHSPETLLACHQGDHPRACGEHRSDADRKIALLGSSPRLRGTPLLHHRRRGQCGIIPALAGNTASIARPSLRRGDHPRACGEHQMVLEQSPYPVGSSPRLRGTRSPPSCSMLMPGIIPALAGNTGNRKPRTVVVRDHPRACGEHTTMRFEVDCDSGSSPRLRGTRYDGNIDTSAIGIIPALAGNTHRRGGRNRSSRGSSPRLRGTQCGHAISILL